MKILTFTLLMASLLGGCAGGSKIEGPLRTQETFLGSTDTTVSDSETDPSDDPDENDASGLSRGEVANQGGGGSSVAGNPLSFTLRLRGVGAIAQLAEPTTPGGNNLLLISEEGITEPSVPTVSHFYTGAEEAALVTESPVPTETDSCQFFHIVTDEEARCLDPTVDTIAELQTAQNELDIPGGHRPVQFDASGNIYFLTSDGMGRWDQALDQVKYLPIDRSYRLLDYLALGDDAIIIKSMNSTGSTFLLKFSSDGSFEKIFEGSVTDFGLFDNDRLIFSGRSDETQEADRLFVVSILSKQLGEIKALTIQRTKEGNQEIKRADERFIGFQRTGAGELYTLAVSRNDPNNRNVYRIDADGAVLLETAVPSIRFFEAHDDDLFIAGQDELGHDLFHWLPGGNPEEETDLLQGKGIRIEHFVVAPENKGLYFDGFLSQSSQAVLGKIALEGPSALLSSFIVLESEIISLQGFDLIP